MIDLSTATATEVLAALRAGTISSAELLEAQLARVEKFNPELNAVVAMDLERARAGARAADEALARGQLLGPLHGLPITIKDLYATEGLVTTSGYVPFKDFVPKKDAAGVAALKKAGAIIYGKTNAPQFGADYPKTARGKADFKRKFKAKLKEVTKLYTGANVDADADNGLVISAGQTSVPKVAKKK